MRRNVAIMRVLRMRPLHLRRRLMRPARSFLFVRRRSSLAAALAVGNAERFQRDFHDAENAEDHGGVDVPHMGDAERLARQRADADP